MAPGGIITSTLSCTCYVDRGTGDPCVCDDRSSTQGYVTVTSTTNSGRSEVLAAQPPQRPVPMRLDLPALKLPAQPQAVKLRARMMLLCIRKGNR